MNPKARTLYSVIRTLRSCFNLLKALVDELHKDLGITASMRAILESIADEGEQTVPQIARGKGVSRQHIQSNVDSLINGKLVVLRHNPAHRRSPLLALTERGTSAFTDMRRREQRVLEELTAGLSRQELETTMKTLVSFKENLIQTKNDGAPDDKS